MITVYAAMFSAILGAAVAYDKLDLPWFASQEDVQVVQQEVASNTKLILGDKWLRLSTQIKQLEAQLTRDPGNRALIERLVRLQQQLRETERQLDK